MIEYNREFGKGIYTSKVTYFTWRQGKFLFKSSMEHPDFYWGAIQKHGKGLIRQQYTPKNWFMT